MAIADGWCGLPVLKVFLHLLRWCFIEIMIFAIEAHQSSQICHGIETIIVVDTVGEEWRRNLLLLQRIPIDSMEEIVFFNVVDACLPKAKTFVVLNVQ